MNLAMINSVYNTFPPDTESSITINMKLLSTVLMIGTLAFFESSLSLSNDLKHLDYYKPKLSFKSNPSKTNKTYKERLELVIS